jgi:hypothetical protein
MRRKINSAVIVKAIIIFSLITVAASGLVYYNKYSKTLADQQTQLQRNKTELQKVNNQLEDVKQEKIKDNDASKQQIDKLEQEKKDLEQQLQAKIEQKSKLAAAVQSIKQTIVPVASADAGCGDDSYANYIYMHESGCRLGATNAEGCVGIGQACPAAKLTSICPLLDYACQNSFFTSYAVARYGSWQGAYNFWLANHWW